jgi:hypothetical protein
MVQGNNNQESSFTGLNFNGLVKGIRQVHDVCSIHAKRAVNRDLTVRNWLIGLYISEFELKGADRAVYGDRLITELSKHLLKLQISNCNRRQLNRYIQFFRTYPEIWGTLSPQLKRLLPPGSDRRCETLIQLQNEYQPVLRDQFSHVSSSITFSEQASSLGLG